MSRPAGSVAALRAQLEQYEQTHVLHFEKSLTKQELKHLYDDIASLDVDSVQRTYAVTKAARDEQSSTMSASAIRPFAYAISSRTLFNFLEKC